MKFGPLKWVFQDYSKQVRVHSHLLNYLIFDSLWKLSLLNSFFSSLDFFFVSQINLILQLQKVKFRKIQKQKRSQITGLKTSSKSKEPNLQLVPDTPLKRAQYTIITILIYWYKMITCYFALSVQRIGNTFSKEKKWFSKDAGCATILAILIWNKHHFFPNASSFHSQYLYWSILR